MDLKTEIGQQPSCGFSDGDCRKNLIWTIAQFVDLVIEIGQEPVLEARVVVKTRQLQLSFVCLLECTQSRKALEQVWEDFSSTLLISSQFSSNLDWLGDL